MGHPPPRPSFARRDERPVTARAGEQLRGCERARAGAPPHTGRRGQKGPGAHHTCALDKCAGISGVGREHAAPIMPAH